MVVTQTVDWKTHWSKTAIQGLIERGIASGYPDGNFRPDAFLTRAEFATLLGKAFPNLVKLREAITFKDVPKTHWAISGITAAYQRGFLRGYPNNLFQPEQRLPRVQAIVALASGMNYSQPPKTLELLPQSFEDSAQIPDYAKSGILSAILAEIIVNYPNVKLLQPNQNITRGEVAVLIAQALRIPNLGLGQYQVKTSLFSIPPRFDSGSRFKAGLAQVRFFGKSYLINKTGEFLNTQGFDDISEFTDTGFARVVINGKYGFVNQKASLVIPAEFDFILDSFTEGMVQAQKGDLWGYINDQGQVITPPQFRLAEPFSEGLALVKNDKAGFIDKTGKLVIPLKFDFAESFHQGTTAVRIDGKWGYIDKTGNLFIEPQFRLAIPFYNGFAAVQIENEQWGYIDKTGKFFISPQFYVADTFSTDGIAKVGIRENFNMRYGYVNTTGQPITPLQFAEAEPFSLGTAVVNLEGKWGLIDTQGNYIVPPEMTLIRPFTDTNPITQLPTLLFFKEQQSGLMDKKGKILIQTPFEEIVPYSPDLLLVKSNQLWGFINYQGQVIVEPKFENFNPLFQALSEGLAAVQLQGKWGYIDAQGQIKIEPQFEQAEAFNQGFAAVKVSSKWGYIDTEGKLIIPPQFDAVEGFSEGLALVNLGGQWLGDLMPNFYGGKWGYIARL